MSRVGTALFVLSVACGCGGGGAGDEPAECKDAANVEFFIEISSARIVEGVMHMNVGETQVAYLLQPVLFCWEPPVVRETEWSVSNPGVLVISPRGRSADITAVGVGEATVAARARFDTQSWGVATKISTQRGAIVPEVQLPNLIVVDP